MKNFNLLQLMIVFSMVLVLSNLTQAYAQEQDKVLWIPDVSCVDSAKELSTDESVKEHLDKNWTIDDQSQYAIGINLLRIGQIDRVDGSFRADLWLWIEPSDSMKERSIDMTKLVEGKNPKEWFDFTNGENIAVIASNDEHDFIEIRVQGTFYSEYDFRNYPFEKLDLSIEVENNIISDNVYTDLWHSAFVESRIISDQSLKAPEIDDLRITSKTVIHTYDFEDAPLDTYCRFIAIFSVSENFNNSFATKIFPIILLTSLGLMPLWMGKEHVPRIILATFLLGSLLFFVNSVTSILPALNYATLYHKIFTVSYALFGLSITTSVIQLRIASKLEKDGKTEERKDLNEKILKKLRKTRTISKILIPVIIVIGIIIFI
jgi:hypothetical protein